MFARTVLRSSSVLVASASIGRVECFAAIGSGLLHRVVAQAHVHVPSTPAPAIIHHDGAPPLHQSLHRHFASLSGGGDDAPPSSTLPKLKVLSKISVTANNGSLLRIRHHSELTNTDMTFSLFLPSTYNNILRSKGHSTPALYWLSGLTCDDTNFAIKAGAFARADAEGIALVIPDTSPRGEDVADDEGYDLGKGAGFYVDATEAPWSDHYKMYSYITRELPSIVEEAYGVGNDAKSIFGHSMGGHGALTIAFKDPESWASVSAFAPISNPTNCAWG
mmetsp:Transcript_10072/g.17683  ORF Transcript_10072/g.17683 Transcript_10072/m.17683 type:complete len:277 (+) Transcript_10072:99-929(+)